MFASTPRVPIDYDPEDRTAPRPFLDVAQAVAGAAVTLATAVSALHKAARSAVAVVQPTLSGWLRGAARMCRFR